MKKQDGSQHIWNINRRPAEISRRKKTLHIVTKGIVIRKKLIGDHNTLLTLLTDGRGVLNCFYKGARKGFGKNTACTQLLAFSEFQLFSQKDRYVVDSASLIEPFLPVATDLELQSLALYLADLTSSLYPEREDSSYLSLFLNTLHLMGKKKISPQQIKAVYEMRVISMSGFFPDIETCARCGNEVQWGRFDCRNGVITCGTCPGNGFPLSKGALAALHHILSASIEKLYSFTLEKTALDQLSAVCEAYALEQAEIHPSSLQYYHSIVRTLYDTTK